jgi:hypothetical protein
MFKSFLSLKVVILLALLYLASIGVALYISSPTMTIFKRDKFDKAIWFADTQAGLQENKNDCMRGKMAQDLIDRILTPQLTKKDVINLLGDAQMVGKNSVEYPVGWCGYNSQTSVYIEFNRDNIQKAYLLKR